MGSVIEATLGVQGASEHASWVGPCWGDQGWLASASAGRAKVCRLHRNLQSKGVGGGDCKDIYFSPRMNHKALLLWLQSPS